jgi:hypothetical protein
MARHPVSHHIIFRITGSNEFGADTGSLSLYRAAELQVSSFGFSGGTKSPVHSSPIPPGTYHINTQIRRVADKIENSTVRVNGDLVMHHWYGIEKIEIPAAWVEWGRYRAALNEPRQGMAQGYRGNFLHGKDRKDDYTHGCICERSEAILKVLWSLPSQVVPVTVERAR